MKNEESKLQSACVQWFRLQYPSVSRLLFAIPNGGNRNAATGAILKREGVIPGVADLMLAIPNRGEMGLFIEMKTPTGRQSRSQAQFMLAVSEQGYRYRIVRTLDEFIETIKEYMA